MAFGVIQEFATGTGGGLHYTPDIAYLSDGT